MIAVPAATQLLASYGAEVLKVEDTTLGDGLRFYGSTKGGMSGWFLNANAGKRSIALDLKSASGKEIFQRLACNADVVIDGFRAGVMDRLGLGHAELSRANPSLIYVNSSGFGARGPYADRPVYDPLVQGLAGWAGAQQVNGQPSLVRAMAADKIGAYNNAQAIMAALIRRGRTGEGAHLETNMLDANLAYVWPDVMMHCTLQDAEGVAHRPNLLQTYRLIRCADGSVAIATGTDKQWQGMCRALERPELADDPRFATGQARGGNIEVWYDVMDDMAATWPVEEVVTRLLAEDVPAAPVLDPEDVYDDPHVRATGMVRESDHPVAGRYRHPQPRANAFGLDLELRPAPQWGEHTVDVLTELDYPREEIDALIDQGAVRTLAR